MPLPAGRDFVLHGLLSAQRHACDLWRHGLQPASSRIFEPDLSAAKAPYGFPVDEVESLVTTDSSQSSPAAGTWYNKGGSLVVPASRWWVEDKETTTKIGINSVTSMRGSVCLCGYLLDLAAKATYYLNCKTGLASMTTITFKGSEQKTKVRAVCGYL